jgi:uncharacterized protein (TIGR03545 family)
MKIFRWSGLLPFVIVTAALAALWWLLLDTLVKHGIESVGTEMVGARVELDSADVGLVPLKLQLKRLQVTDPEQPMHNMVEVGDMVASLEPWKLLMGQVVIDEMSISGLQLNTPRSRSGAIAKKTEAVKEQGEEKSLGKQAGEVLGQLAGELPSAKEVLAKEPLLVTSRSEELKTNYQQSQQRLEQLQAQLPDKKAQQSYQQRFKQATEGQPKTLQEFNARKKELEQLQSELKAVKQNLAQTKEHLQLSGKELAQQLAALKRAPGEDLKRLREKYSLSAEGGLNLTRLLFGDRAHYWAATALTWYQRVEPYLASDEGEKAQEMKPQRATGRFIRFPSKAPTPDFLLRKAKFQAVLPIGDIDGELHDLTHQPQILGRPATLTASASRLKRVEQLALDATFDHRDSAKAEDHMALKLKGLQLEGVELIGSDSFPLALQQARSDIDGTLSLRQGALKAAFNSDFSGARFTAEAKGDIARELAASLAAIDQFRVEGSIGGSLASPKLTLRSDLDQRLSGQFKKRLKARQAEFEQKLRAELESRISSPRTKYEQKLKQLKNTEKEVDALIAENERMLKAKLADFQQQQQQQLQQKADDKLKEQLKGLKF